ncbi:hypothetical protein [Aliamphritea spongicola]|nr:hypothetical protein [Aliamphritea spongicola]
MVDEADGVLLDEARTPLIISGEEVPQDAQQQVYMQAMALLPELEEGKDYRILRQQRQIEMTPDGEQQALYITRNLGPCGRGGYGGLNCCGSR